MSGGPPHERVLIAGYLRRFDGWSRLCEAMAAVLGVPPSQVIALEASGDPVAFLSARTQHGDFAVAIEAFVDRTRAPGFAGKDAMMAALARQLGVEILYDDSSSTIPYRWVLASPEGKRFEVFERPDDGPDLRLDPAHAPRPLLGGGGKP